MYRLKIVLIVAKRAVDFIGYLDEEPYQAMLWDHEPLTDFWHIGVGSARRLARYGITTMGQITQTDEDLLYRLFGIDAELLIDHAWGREPVTIADIKARFGKNAILKGINLKQEATTRERNRQLGGHRSGE